MRQLRDAAAEKLYRIPEVAEAAKRLARLLNPAISSDALSAAFVADDSNLDVLASVAIFAGPLRPERGKASSNLI